MKFRISENLFRILLLILLAVISSFGLWSYSHARRDYLIERERYYEAKSQCITLQLKELIKNSDKKDLLEKIFQKFFLVQNSKTDISIAAIGFYGPDGNLITKWAQTPQLEILIPSLKLNKENDKSTSSIFFISEKLNINENDIGTLYFIFVDENFRLSEIIKILYELPLWLIGVILLYCIGKQFLFMLRSTNNEMSISSESGEIQFVMNSYQSVIDRLQIKGKELEQLRKEEQARAEFSEQFSDRLVASIPNALIVVAINEIILVTNLQARKLFSLSSMSNNNEKLRIESFFQNATEIIQLIKVGLITHEVQNKSEAKVQIGKKTYFLEVSVSPICNRLGICQGVLCLISDRTEMIDLRNTLQIKSTLVNLGEMAAGIAHEFKNSLATISGYAQIIERTGTSSIVKAAQGLRQETIHLSNVVTDFLNFAHPHDIKHSVIYIMELIEDCCKSLSDSIKEKNITVMITGEFPNVRGDFTLLRRAFLNLFQNAIEAISEESQERKITIQGNRNIQNGRGSGYYKIIISDTGKGIPEVELSKVFIPFFTTKSRGYGIGLALVQKVFLGHNGYVEVISELGKGSTFTCYIPDFRLV